MINKKQLFKTAWGLAKNAAWSFGGKPVEYFALCLKHAWLIMNPVKKAPVEKIAATTKVNEIKSWFVEKNLTAADMSIYFGREEITTLQETTKAVFVKIANIYGQSFKIWLPKSCIAA